MPTQLPVPTGTHTLTPTSDVNQGPLSFTYEITWRIENAKDAIATVNFYPKGGGGEYTYSVMIYRLMGLYSNTGGQPVLVIREAYEWIRPMVRHLVLITLSKHLARRLHHTSKKAPIKSKLAMVHLPELMCFCLPSQTLFN
jgi:hypothetical protein